MGDSREKQAILAARFGGQYVCHGENAQAYCRYYNWRPGERRLLCDDCSDAQLCAKNPPLTGMGRYPRMADNRSVAIVVDERKEGYHRLMLLGRGWGIGHGAHTAAPRLEAN